VAGKRRTEHVDERKKEPVSDAVSTAEDDVVEALAEEQTGPEAADSTSAFEVAIDSVFAAGGGSNGGNGKHALAAVSAVIDTSESAGSDEASDVSDANGLDDVASDIEPRVVIDTSESADLADARVVIDADGPDAAAEDVDSIAVMDASSAIDAAFAGFGAMGAPEEKTVSPAASVADEVNAAI